MDNKDKIDPNEDLLIVELDDRLEFSSLPIDVMDLQANCTNTGCNPNDNSSGCTNLSDCRVPPKEVES